MSSDRKGKKGAFVYGSYSFSDKFSCGIVLYFFTTEVIEKENVLKITTALLPPLSMFFAFLCVLIRTKKVEEKEKENKEDMTDQEKEKERMIEEKKTDDKSVIDDSRFTFVTLK